MTRHDPDLTYVARTLTDDTAWLARHAQDLHELAYGQAGGDPDIIIQTHSTGDIADLIGTHAQDAWHTLLDVCRRLEAAKAEVSRLFAAGRQEWRPPARLTRDDEFDRRQTLAAARRRRQDPDQYTPAPLNPETGLR